MNEIAKFIAVGLSIGLAVLCSRDAAAYERYNDGCQTCHGHFADGVSPKGGPERFPKGDRGGKHHMHRNGKQMDAECSLCHTSGDNKDPWIGSSNGTADNPGYGCSGCHGRNADAGNDAGISSGRGAGLRQHHTNAGEPDCMDCHWDANPLNYTPVAEAVKPEYYNTVDVDARIISPLNLIGDDDENWTVGDAIGLDNDGDQLYDSADQGGAEPIAIPGGPYLNLINVLVQFDGSESLDLDGTIDTYDWNFGDGSTVFDAGPTPVHTYTVADKYTVTLTVTDNDGGTGVASTTADIQGPDTVPPVNQIIGVVDKTIGQMTADDCNSCHIDAPERHHTYAQTQGWLCTQCHSPPNNSIPSDCTTVGCHDGGNLHHGAGDATIGICTTCHGDIVDNVGVPPAPLAHYVPSYSPSMVTPFRSGGTGSPLNSNGHGAGACDYCHNDDGLSTPIIETNRNLHHGTGLDDCTWCHIDNGPTYSDDDGLQMRVCENCHGPDSLHSIQADSPNAGNPGSLVVGGEDAGYGHVGRDGGPGDSDCWGCHGFGFSFQKEALVTAAADPLTDAVVPTVYGCEPATMTAGTDTAVAVGGSGLTNTTGTIQYESNAVLTAADGSTKVTLVPAFIDEGVMGVLIDGNTAPGNYMLRAVKTDSNDKPVASNPVSFCVLPEVYITTAVSPKTIVTLTGGGFSGYAKGSGTAVVGTRRVRGRSVSKEGTVVSWNDTTIVALFDARPDSVTVHTVFGSSATSAVVKKPRKKR